jgi:hypothetical protein
VGWIIRRGDLLARGHRPQELGDPEVLLDECTIDAEVRSGPLHEDLEGVQVLA